MFGRQNSEARGEVKPIPRQAAIPLARPDWASSLMMNFSFLKPRDGYHRPVRSEMRAGERM